MKIYFLVFGIMLLILNSCSNPPTLVQQAPPATPAGSPIDTAKLRSDLNDVISAATTAQPDTNKIKKAGSDILTTDAAILSDSGIDKMGGDTNDPSVNKAKAILKDWRNKMGITPAALDSIKKAGASLKSN